MSLKAASSFACPVRQLHQSHHPTMPRWNVRVGKIHSIASLSLLHPSAMGDMEQYQLVPQNASPRQRYFMRWIAVHTELRFVIDSTYGITNEGQSPLGPFEIRRSQTVESCHDLGLASASCKNHETLELSLQVSSENLGLWRGTPELVSVLTGHEVPPNQIASIQHGPRHNQSRSWLRRHSAKLFSFQFNLHRAVPLSPWCVPFGGNTIGSVQPAKGYQETKEVPIRLPKPESGSNPSWCM